MATDDVKFVSIAGNASVKITPLSRVNGANSLGKPGTPQTLAADSSITINAPATTDGFLIERVATPQSFGRDLQLSTRETIG